MNKREIDELMKDLPSQRPVESLLAKIGIILLFMGIFSTMAMLPDTKHKEYHDSQKSNCREGR